MNRATLKKYLYVFLFFLLWMWISPQLGRGGEDSFRECLYRGRILFNQGKFGQCLEEYEKAEEIDFLAKETILNLAIVYKNLRQYKEAIEQYKTLLTLEPHRIVYLNLGEIYYLNSMPKEAISAFNYAIKMGEQSGLVYFWLGKCFADKGDRDNAELNYEAAVKKDDQFVLAHLALGRLYTEKKIWEKAQEEFEKVKELDPSITEIYSALARSYFQQAKYEEALAMFGKARAVDPEDKEAQLYINEIYKIKGEGFKKELAKKATERRSLKPIRMVKPKKVKQAPLVRVYIGQAKILRFKCGLDFVIKDEKEESSIFAGKENEVYTLVSKGQGIRLFLEKKPLAEFKQKINLSLNNPQATIVIFELGTAEGQYWAAKIDKAYRGRIEITSGEKEELKIVNAVNLEEYIYGVLPSEMSCAWPKEALKAQAVAARSEAYVKLGRHKQEGFDFCSDVHCQVYSGANIETEATNQVVDETCGEIAVDSKGRPIDAIYSNSCGGYTQENIFGKKEEVSYLKGRLDALDEIDFFFPLSPLELEDWLWAKDIPVNCNNVELSRSSNFRWMRCYEKEELEKLINKKLKIGSLISLTILERDNSAHIKKIEILGTQGKFIIDKELEIRKLLGNLRSSMFNLDVKVNREAKAQEFIFYGGGWGHGVGMCQSGAATLAQKGHTYQDILKFYYSGIEIKKMY